MKEHPIIFNADMVRAILAGRKAQTRRPMKPQPVLDDFGGLTLNGQMLHADYARKLCPFGQPGERLWVRETFAQQYNNDDSDICVYKADMDCPPDGYSKWLPSIHMPRWASRITLEVTAVRVERLQDISEAGAVAEGCSINGGNPSGLYVANNARSAFCRVWQSIHGPDSWGQNPWVWVIEFRRVEP